MQKILFIELLGGIGDVLIALPAIQALARSYPTAKLTVLTFAPGGEFLQTDPLVYQVICVAKGEARIAVEKLLAAQAFDLIVSDSSYEGIDQLIHQSGTARVVTNLWRSPPPNEFVGERFIHLLLQDQIIQPEAIAPAELHLTLAERQQAEANLKQLHHPIVVLYPDAGMAIKRWPSTSFVELGQALQKQYGATILVPAGADQAQADTIATKIGDTARIWPRGTLRQLAAFLAYADLMVASDTGPARIAAALNVPTITLFGPSWHQRYGQPAPHVNLQGYPSCPDRKIHNFTEQACWYAGVCPFDQWNSCLEDISVAQVMAIASKILDSTSQSSRF